MARDSFNVKPDGFVITIDGAIVEEAGANGLISTLIVAERIERAFIARYPEKNIKIIGCFRVRKHQRGKGDYGL
jgi:hypothetical protein